MNFDIDCQEIISGLDEINIKSKIAMDLYADTSAKKLEKYSKENANWVDRTGIARKTIQGGKQWEGEKCIVYVSGNAKHSPYLELCNDKKHAILKPTIDKLSPEILRGMKKLLRK